MKRPRKRTRRGVHYEALAEGFRMMKSPLAETFEATSEHYEQTDQGGGEGRVTTEVEVGAKGD